MAFTIVLMAFGLSLLFLAPHHVQYSDSAELVTRAYLATVSHPPGYPLFTLLGHLVTREVPWSTPIFRLACLNIFCASAIFGLLWRLAGSSRLLILMLTTALSAPLFVRQVLIPDLFALHALFITLLSGLYFSRPNNLKTAFLLIFIFCLAMAHHPTTLFLLPLPLVRTYQYRHHRWTWVAWGLGALSWLACQGLLFTFHPLALESWGEITHWRALLHHILRLDYGAFALSAHQQTANPLAFCGGLLPILLSQAGFLLIALLVGRPARLTQHQLIYIASLLAYLLVFSWRGNIALEGWHGEILRRFYLMPFLMTLILCGVLLRPVRFSRRQQLLLLVLTGLVGVANLQQNWQQNRLAHNTVIEDFAINVLKEVPESNAIILVVGDDQIQSIEYVQRVLGIRPELTIIAPSLLTYRWYREKLMRAAPDLQIPLVTKQLGPNFYMADLEASLIRQNRHRPIYFMRRLRSQITSSKFFSTGLLYKISVAATPAAPPPPRLQRTHITAPSRDFNLFAQLYFEYGKYYLDRGVDAYQKQDFPQARRWFEQALLEVNYFYPARYNLCYLNQIEKRDTTHCRRELKRLQSEVYPYWQEWF